MKKLNKEWVQYFLDISIAVSKKSKDNSTKLGAIIIGVDNEIISTGYNSFPRGVNDDLPERYERPMKYNWTPHAELNAIINAARVGVSTKNGTLFLSTGFTCHNCAMAIINAGIKTVYVHQNSTFSKRQDWSESFQIAQQMYDEAEVEVIYYESVLG